MILSEALEEVKKALLQKLKETRLLKYEEVEKQKKINEIKSKENKYDQATVGTIIGIKQSAYSSMERGETQADLARLFIALDYLGEDPLQIFLDLIEKKLSKPISGRKDETQTLITIDPLQFVSLIAELRQYSQWQVARLEEMDKKLDRIIKKLDA